MSNSIQFEDGIVIGEVEDKENLSNPIARALVAGYNKHFLRFIRDTQPSSIHEVGCGSGRLANITRREFQGPLRLSDFSTTLTANHSLKDEPDTTVVCKSIYDLDESDHADMIICCEVLEHLGEPERALHTLQQLKARTYLFSVPREPLWRALNMIRGKYLGDFGNTPGHLQHWSSRQFVRLLEQNGFVVDQVATPLPWTMILANCA